MRRALIIGAALGTAAYLWLRKKRTPPLRAVPAPPARARLAFGGDANLCFYAARFDAAGQPMEPEDVMACALFDPRVAALLRRGGEGPAIETVRADLRARVRHGRGEEAVAADFNPGEHYANARITLRLLVSSRRAHELAEKRGATAISLGDLLRAFRERGGLLAELIPDDPARLAPLDAPREVDVAARAPLADGVDAGEVEVYAVNDAVSRMDFVLHTLAQHWGLGPARAAFAMLETHDKGHGLVGRFGVADARARQAAAAELARQQQMPLRFVLLVPAPV